MDFEKHLQGLKINLTEEIKQRFDTYYHFLVSYNEKVNLTAITDYDGVYMKHFYDSLLLSSSFDFTKELTCVDVGAGAGFPSIPNAICFPNLNVTIIDALNKRITFLNELVEKLGISNVSALHERAEDYATKKRESFDIATARAVARLNVLVELCLPLVKVGGYFLALKSVETEDEIKEAKNAIRILGGEVVRIDTFELPNELGSRTVVVIKKVSSTPKKYPRQFAQIKNKPL